MFYNGFGLVEGVLFLILFKRNCQTKQECSSLLKQTKLFAYSKQRCIFVMSIRHNNKNKMDQNNEKFRK